MTDLRDNLAAFADKIGWRLEPWQVEALSLLTQISVIVAPRQSASHVRSPCSPCGGHSATDRRAS